MKTPERAVETPSGKKAGDENFPVGSFLLPKELRPHVARYYAFARAIDDIADNQDLQAIEKTERLEGFGRAIRGLTSDPVYEKALVLRASMIETGVNPCHALDLISAFKQDAVKPRYKNWDDLMDYCNRSASPVGRYLLELHGEDKAAFKYSDALCNALQVINHLQDCRDDYLGLNRVYLPKAWLRKFGSNSDDLKREAATPGLQKTILRCVLESRKLMEYARQLPAHLSSRALAMESAVIVRIADKLLDKLERQDPLAMRVELTKMETLMCGVSGVLTGLFTRKAKA
jgi:squalene synthase HpnC